MNKNYVSGRRFEYKVRDYLEAHGYYVVRSAGSHGAIDLVGIRKKIDPKFCGKDAILVQCKNNPKLSETTEKLDEIVALCSITGFHAYMAFPGKRRGTVRFERIV